MKTIQLFCSTKDKNEQNLKLLSLSQLQSSIQHESTIDVIKFNSEKEYLETKDALTTKYDLRNTKQMLLVIECANDKFKRNKEVHHV